MHQPLDAGDGASLEQGDGRVGVDTARVVAQAALQDANAIHHGVDVLQPRQPMRDLDIIVEVASDPLDVGVDAARKLEIAPGAYDGDAFPPQRRDDRAADEAVSPGHEAAHAQKPFRSANLRQRILAASGPRRDGLAGRASRYSSE